MIKLFKCIANEIYIDIGYIDIFNIILKYSILLYINKSFVIVLYNYLCSWIKEYILFIFNLMLINIHFIHVE